MGVSLHEQKDAITRYCQRNGMAVSEWFEERETAAKTGRYSLHALAEEMQWLGLRRKSGAPLSVNGMSILLNNPFYTGLIRLRTTNQVFQGVHRPPYL